MKTRKWAAALLLATVLTTAGTAMAATVPGAVYSDFQAVGENKPVTKVAEDLAKAGVKDIKADYWAAGSISVMIEAGLLKPDANGNVNPDAKLNTAEGVAVFAKVLGIASKTDTPDQALTKAKEAGIVGVGASSETELSRAAVAHLLAAALGVEPKLVTGPENYPFADYADTDPADRGILAALYELGIFKGYIVDGVRTFRPGNVLTRAEIAILVDRILGAGN